jgi:hypothetical protein
MIFKPKHKATKARRSLKLQSYDILALELLNFGTLELFFVPLRLGVFVFYS